ncbi:nucleotidyltransferase domain-containing protein [Marispirochaeta sp.]|uniref:nucleotidyltransferase domain-containing protein n=1 Tax=Marispirochaeta sp. TaxID=2038653 RepID=UPI0029C82242|nr:nucleotidyltransferase domain-containing protein [Marispirochaeta sp.]
MMYTMPVKRKAAEINPEVREQTFSVQKAADRIRRIRQGQDLKLKERRQRAQESGRKIAVELGAADPGLEKVIGFGSTYETWRKYREDSDIDLALIGGDWFKLMRHVPEGEFQVSLVELMQQNPEFISYVLEHGEVLYEKQ